jgi:hypothetical protein
MASRPLTWEHAKVLLQQKDKERRENTNALLDLQSRMRRMMRLEKAMMPDSTAEPDID